MTAAHGLEAMKLLRSDDRFDVILLDLNMPVMDGPQFMLAREREALAAGVPVIVFAAAARRDIPGVAAWMDKPIEMESLLSTVIGHIQSRRSQPRERLLSPGAGEQGDTKEIEETLGCERVAALL